MQKYLGSIQLRLSSLFKSCGLWTLCLWLCRFPCPPPPPPPPLINETFKQLPPLPILMHNHYGGDSAVLRMIITDFFFKSWCLRAPLFKRALGSVCVCVSFCLCLFVSLSLRLSLSLSVSLSVSVSLYFCLCLSLPVCVCVCVCLSLSLSVSRSLSLVLYFICLYIVYHV